MIIKIQTLVLSSLAMLFGGVILTLISIPLEGLNFGIKPFEYYASLIWLCLVSATAVPIWFVLLKRPRVKVSDLNFWKFIMPVTGVILSWAILTDEKPGIIPLTGMFIVSLSLVFLNIYKARRG
jgi:drug/metabolite transporter (DMT)-like permease